MPTADFSSGDSELDRIIAEYIEAIERGEKPDVDALLLAHPEHREALRQFVDDYHRLGATNVQPFAPEASSEPDSKDALAGTLIAGRYKLIENIGEGGMGSVWVAEQKEPVKRKVAIKLIKAGMDSKQVLARFEAERQALALMDHPNIARVFDGGMTEQGRPFFVMEYVKGIPFTDYCDHARLSLKERLELFIPVCQAVQHAHHKGIVHRDLKPSNILICLYDGKPVPKVIDFGLAKAMHQQLTELSLHTAHGVMVGTPIYMSPEQAELNNLDVDTRTDIYSLGVVLYELLTGTTPLGREQLRRAAYDEILKLIKEAETPRPSTRLSGHASLPNIAAQRRIDPKTLQKTLSGDLDWIVMKSLEKERSRRYESCVGLQRDVERFLAGDVVEACPPSVGYNLRRFMRRNRIKVLVGSIVLLSLLVSIAASSWGWSQAKSATATIKQSYEELANALEREKRQRALAETQTEIAQRQFIEGILRPIGHENIPDIVELRSFIDWAAIEEPDLKIRVLETAFERPEVALRVARRSERSIQACVSLSPARRVEVLKFLNEKQQFDVGVDPRIRVAAAWMSLELGSRDVPALLDCLAWLSDTPANTYQRDYYRLEYTAFLDCLVRHIETVDKSQIPSIAAILIADLQDTRNIVHQQYAANAIGAISSRLTVEQRATVVEALISLLEDQTHYIQALVAAERALISLLPGLTRDQLTRGWSALVRVHGLSDYYGWTHRSNGFVAIATMLTPEECRKAGDALISSMEMPKQGTAYAELWKDFLAVSSHLTAEQMRRAGRVMIDKIDPRDDHGSDSAFRAIVHLAEILDAEQTERAWNKGIEFLKAFTQNSILIADEALLSLLPRVSREQQLMGCEALIQVLETRQSLSTARVSAALLKKLVGLQSTEQCRKWWDMYIGNIKSGEVLGVREEFGLFLAGLAPKLSVEQQSAAWSELLATLAASETCTWYQQQAIGHILEALAFNLEDAQVSPVGDRLIEMLERYKEHPYSVPATLKALRTLVPRLSEYQLGRLRMAVVRILASSEWPYVREAAGQSLTTLFVVGHQQEIASIGDALISVQTTTMDFEESLNTGERLVALAPMLNADARQRIGDAFMETMRRNRRGNVPSQVFALMPFLDVASQRRFATQVTTMLLDDGALADYYHETWNTDDGFDSAAFQWGGLGLTDKFTVAGLMQHPGAIGEARVILLKRFEELVFHDGERVFLKPLQKEPGEQRIKRMLTENDSTTLLQDPETSHRRFHTVYDAAAWIQENWPNFDLDATHPVSDRGKW